GLLGISGAVLAKKRPAGRKYFCGASRHSRVWGRHSPTRFPRGAKPQNCGFWHRGRNLLCNCLRLPLSGSSVHRTDRTGLAARCGRPFFLSAKDTFQRPPATRWTGIFQNFFCLSNPGTVVLATGGAENFSFHSPHHRVLKFAKRGRQLFSGFIYLLRVTLRFCQMDNKKSSKSFSDLLLSLAAGSGWYSVLKVQVRLPRR